MTKCEVENCNNTNLSELKWRDEDDSYYRILCDKHVADDATMFDIQGVEYTIDPWIAATDLTIAHYHLTCNLDVTSMPAYCPDHEVMVEV
jgi:hypothetical protein